jgi:hypothetical protein
MHNIQMWLIAFIKNNENHYIQTLTSKDYIFIEDPHVPNVF